MLLDLRSEPSPEDFDPKKSSKVSFESSFALPLILLRVLVVVELEQLLLLLTFACTNKLINSVHCKLKYLISPVPNVPSYLAFFILLLCHPLLSQCVFSLLFISCVARVVRIEIELEEIILIILLLHMAVLLPLLLAQWLSKVLVFSKDWLRQATAV